MRGLAKADSKFAYLLGDEHTDCARKLLRHPSSSNFDSHAHVLSMCHTPTSMHIGPQVLLKWCMMRGIPALVKTERPERVEENFVGFDWRLTYEQKVGGFGHVSICVCVSSSKPGPRGMHDH